MKLTHSLVHAQQNSLVCLPKDRETGSEQSNIMKKCICVKNSPDTVLNSSDLKNRSADVIKSFFKKAMAAQSYNKMFSKGSNFRELNIALTDSSARKASLHSLQHLDKVSKNYLSEIKGKTQSLTEQEKILLRKVIDAKIHFRHQSNSNLVDAAGILNIMSLDNLQAKGINTAKNTYPEDIKCLNNQDFFLVLNFLITNLNSLSTPSQYPPFNCRFWCQCLYS